MEINQEEAEICIQRAEKCIEKKDFGKARKFLEKSNRMYPSQKATDLLSRVQRLERLNREHRTQRHYTKEELEEVQRVNACRNDDHRGILGVGSGANKALVKRKYRELIIKIHPDKNGAPGSEEAFIRIRNAYEMLIVKGDNNYVGNKKGDQSDDETHQRFYARDFDSRERGKTFRTAYGRWRWEEKPQPRETNYSQYMPYLCLIALGVCWLVWNVFIPSKPLYSLETNSEFPYLRKTQTLKIPFFVQRTFNKYGRQLRELEKSIEEEYLEKLDRSCNEEKNRRDALMWKARNFNDRKLFKEAHYMSMSKCDQFENGLKLFKN